MRETVTNARPPPSLFRKRGHLANRNVVAAVRACGYFRGMTPTVEERLEQLEKQVAELGGELAESRKSRNGWEKSFAAFKDDPDFESAVRLGREWREAQTYEKEIAGS